MRRVLVGRDQLTVREIATATGLSCAGVCARIRKGWSPTRIVSPRVRGRYAHRVLRKCLRCAKQLRLLPHAARKGRRYCSARCANQYRHWGRRSPTTRVRCAVCKRFKRLLPAQARRTAPGRPRFCSRRCQGRWRVGARSTSWRGGVTNNGLYWKRLARKRDGARCVGCGVVERSRLMRRGKQRFRASSLHVHHLIPREAGGTHALSNLVTLCPRCHGKAENAFLAEIVTLLPVRVRAALRRRLLVQVRSTTHRIRQITILERQ